MIVLTTEQQDALAAGSVVRRLFLTIEVTDTSSPPEAETLGFWDGLEDIDLGTAWPTFVALGGRPEMSSVQQVLDGSIPGVMLTVSGVPDTPLADMIVDESVRWAQRPAVIYLGIFDPETMAVIGPLIPLQVGYLDKATFVDGAVGEEALLQISIESAAREMTRSNESVRSDLDQRDRFSGDEGFAYVARDYRLPWGVPQKRRKNKGKRGKDKRGKR